MIRALLAFAIVGLCHPVHAEPEPSWKFRVLKSAHFEIIYQQEQLTLAKKYALASEQAYDLLWPIFQEAPSKTIVVLTDETDESNGMATFLPYPAIYVYPVLPSAGDTVDEFGDWPLEMMVHEYTHILNMYSSHGIYVPLRWLFGNVVRPNAILPKWYLEGLAVTLESRLTTHGRLRSTETAASARAWWKGGKMDREGVAEINEQSFGTWPYGARPYLFGGWWWSEALSRNAPVTDGEVAPTPPKSTMPLVFNWNQNFSRRLPFLLNGPMREQTGQSAEELWNSTKTSLTRQTEAQLKTLGTAHVTRAVAAEPGEQSVFAVSPSGRHLVYLVSRHRDRGTQVRIKTREPGPEPKSFADLPSEQIFKTRGTSRVRWLNEDQLILDQLDIRRPYVTYRDLYTYSLSDQKLTRLTQGQRAAEPAPSLKGDRVAFIQNHGGRTRLVLLDMNTRQSKILISGGFGQRLSGPEFLDDQRIAFTLRLKSGKENVQVYNFTDRSIKPYNQDLTSTQNIRRTARGLLGTDARTRVRNAYRIGAGTSSSQALSNTHTDIAAVDLDPIKNELLLSELTHEGRRLVSLPVTTFQPVTLAPPALPAPPKSTISSVKLQSENYVPLYYLWPRYWIPMLYPVENGVLLQGISSVNDPAGRNEYTLFGSYDTVTQQPSYGIDYANHSFSSDIGLGYAKSVRYLAANDRTLESQATYANLTHRWPFDSRFVTWSTGGLSVDTQGKFRDYHRAGPTGGLRYSRLSDPLGSWFGLQMEAQHEEFLAGGNRLAYGRTRLHLAQSLSIGGGQRILLRTRGAFSPKLPRSAILDLGESSLGGNYLVSLSNSDYLVRGYPSGTFVGRKLLNANLEYSLPLFQSLGGWGTFPMFLNDLELALFADAVSVDGGAYDTQLRGHRSTTLSQFFSGTGLELRLNSTTGYHLPVSFILGAYYGLDTRYGGGFSPFFGIGLGDLGALRDKTP